MSRSISVVVLLWTWVALLATPVSAQLDPNLVIRATRNNGKYVSGKVKAGRTTLVDQLCHGRRRRHHGEGGPGRRRHGVR